MKIYRTLLDVSPDWMTKGIFSKLASLDVPWAEDEDITAANLDLEYYGNHSGEKVTSPLVDKLLDTDGELPEAKVVQLAALIFGKYKAGWAKLWEINISDYDPLENYRMLEEETIDTDTTRTPNLSRERSETRTPDLTDTEVLSDAETVTDNDVYAYNSGTPSPESKQTVTDGHTVTTTKTGTEGYSEEISETGTEENALDTTRELTRSGNIGVTTSQQMAESEINLRKWNFFDNVFRDIDEVLTSKIYILSDI